MRFAGTLNFLSNGANGCTEALMEEQGNYPSIYWACGNFVGLHMHAETAAFTHSQVVNDPIEVYVR